MTNNEKQKLQDLRDSYYLRLAPISSDFVDDRVLSDSCYISDSFSEYADSATSIYYSDQHNYYVDHSDACEDTILEFMDPDNIADYIKRNGLYYLCCYAGALGEYVENERQLYEDQELIKKCLIIDFLLNVDIYLDYDKIEEIADNDLDRWDDYCDLINEANNEK